MAWFRACPFTLVVQAEDFARAGEGDEFDFARIARLEAHRGARGNVQPKAARGFAIESQRGVHFVEMEMAADLDRTVAGVRDFDALCLEADVGLEIAARDDFAGNDLVRESSDHRIGLMDGDSFVPSGNVASTCTS